MQLMAIDWFTYIKDWYNEGLWDKSMVREAVVMGKITEEEYKDITKEDYNSETE